MTRVSKQIRNWFGSSRTTSKPRRRTQLSVEQLGERLLPSANTLAGEGVLAGHGQAMVIDSNSNVYLAVDQLGKPAQYISTNFQASEVALGTDVNGRDEFWAVDFSHHVFHFDGHQWQQTGSQSLGYIVAGHGKVFATDASGYLWQLDDGPGNSWHMKGAVRLERGWAWMSYTPAGADGHDALFVERYGDMEVFEYSPSLGNWTDTGASYIFALTATSFGAIGTDQNDHLTHYLANKPQNGWFCSSGVYSVNPNAGFQADSAGNLWYVDRNALLHEYQFIDVNHEKVTDWWGNYYDYIQVGPNGMIFGLQTGGSNDVFELNTGNDREQFMGTLAFGGTNWFSAGTGLDGGPELWEVNTDSFGDRLLNEFSYLQSTPNGIQYYVGCLYFNWWPIILW